MPKETKPLDQTQKYDSYIAELFNGSEKTTISFLGHLRNFQVLLREKIDKHEIDAYLIYSAANWKRFKK